MLHSDIGSSCDESWSLVNSDRWWSYSNKNKANISVAPDNVENHNDLGTITATTTVGERPSLNWRILWMRYCLMLSLAASAVWLDWKMHQYVESMSKSTQDGLRIATIAFMERLEGIQLRNQAHKEELDADYLFSKSEEFEEEGKEDVIYAQKMRIQGQYLYKMAMEEQDKAQINVGAVEQTVQLRTQVLANLTDEEKKQKLLEEKLRQASVHQGLCSWTFFRSVCDVIGGVTALRSETDLEAMKIQWELQQVNSLERQEYVERFITGALSQNAEEFNHTGRDLVHLAELWDERAQALFQQAQRANRSAHAHREDAARQEFLARQVEKYQAEATAQVQQYLHEAQIQHIRACWCAVVSIVLAFLVFVYFSFAIVDKERLSIWMELFPGVCFHHRGDNNVILMKNVVTWSYIVVHILLFFMVAGMTGEYFENMSNYSMLAQRAVVVLWFAFCGSLFQTVFLHALPKCLQLRYSATETHLVAAAINIGVKWLILFCIYLMEVLCVWILPFGRTVFSHGVVNFCNTVGFGLVTVSLALIIGLYIGTIGQTQELRSATNRAIGWGCDNFQSSKNVSVAEVLSDGTYSIVTATEITPLCKHEILSPGTIVELNANCSESVPHALVLSRSHPADSWLSLLRDESERYLLPTLELLVIALMVAVLQNGWQTIWNSQIAGWQFAILACAAGWMVIGAVVIRDFMLSLENP